ncbi:MAG: Rha family transcriptional regulator [Sterolibacterium sp.]|nr:Rha family transcriptional regulator [Sterolibacterium sp.]
MNDIALAIHNGSITTTSRQIAEHFGKRHFNVLRDIAKLDCSDGFRQLNFESANYIDEQGKPRQEYNITRDGFAFLCMGFTGPEAAAWKERYIAAFNAIEARLIAELRQKASHVLPIPGIKRRARDGLRFKETPVLQRQSRETMEYLLAAEHPMQRFNLHCQLRQINDALGIPTPTLTEIDAVPLALPIRGEG